jgi:acyl-CoA thioester hydrolase
MKNVTSYRVIYGDTDQMGVVYYANYLRWFERGRSELLRQLGLPYKSIEEQGFHFPVTEVSCRYLNSARYDDMILIQTQLISIGRASLNFSYTILKEIDDSLLAVGATKHACIALTDESPGFRARWRNTSCPRRHPANRLSHKFPDSTRRASVSSAEKCDACAMASSISILTVVSLSKRNLFCSASMPSFAPI